MVERHNIPNRMILNIDKTPPKYVSVGNFTLAEKAETSVTVEETNYKRCIKGMFRICLNTNF